MMLLSASALSVLGQQLTPDYSQEIGKYKSASNYIVESYVSPKGDYSLLMTPGHFYLWDGAGKLLTERDLMPKSNESVENEPRFFKTVEEGSGFMVMPGGEAVVLLDWGIGKGMVEVIDLKSGKSQWKSNQIGFANSAEGMAKKEGTKLAASILVKETGMNGGGEERIKKSQNPFLISQDQSFASKYVKSLITPLPDGNILIKTLIFALI